MKLFKSIILFLLISNLTFSTIYYIPQATISQENHSLEKQDISSFYPIGWSEEGAFAYVIFDNYDSALADYTDFRFYIKDMVTDEMIFEGQYYDSSLSRGFKETWDYFITHQYDLNSLLNEYNIEINYWVSFQGSPVTEFPMLFQSDSFYCEIEKFFEDPGDYVMSSYSVKASSTVSGIKYIVENQPADTIDITISGFIQSPYEERIAVILLEYRESVNGLPLIVEPVPVGCHLTYGF